MPVVRPCARATGIPYRQIVVFHMTKSVRREYVYKVTRDSIRPAAVEGNIVRIHTELTELAPDDITLYLAVVPNRHEELDAVHAAIEELVEFHERHGFKGHIVLIGDYAISEEEVEQLQQRIEGSTLVTVPVE